MLHEYKRKRDFKITPEPSGAEKAPKTKAAKKKSLTFVIQKHAATRLHYDFRLEIDGVMVSWAVPKGPSLNPKDKRLAVMTEDHPMEYSSFEGIIPAKQYGAGEVIIWDQGVYSPDENAEYSWEDKDEANERMRQGVKKGKLSFYLKGDKLEGSWTLVKLHNKDKEWLLIKHHDEFESSSVDITAQNESVVSGQTIEDLQENGADRIWTRDKGSSPADRKTTGESSKQPAKESKGSKGSKGPKESPAKLSVVRDKSGKLVSEGSEKSQKSLKSLKVAAKNKVKVTDIDDLLKNGRKAAYPKEIAPMLATLVDAPFSMKGWFFEPKFDGVRAIAYIKDGSVRLSSRRGLNLSSTYSSVCESLLGYDDNIVLDGEVVALDEHGKPSFQALQQSGVGLRSFSSKTQAEIKARLYYYVFDIIYAAGKSLINRPLTDRKIILESLLKVNDTVRLVGSLGSDGEAIFQACVENGLEGIVGKREDSVYETGTRSRAWLKVKTTVTSEFIICGFTQGTGSRQHTFGSLMLGEYDSNGTLQYVGNVGTGLNEKKLDALLKVMKPLAVKQCPFKTKPTGKLNPTWITPKLIAEVKFMERTRDNILRAPVYLHLRDDIEPKQVKPSPVVHVKSESKEDKLVSTRHKSHTENDHEDNKDSTDKRSATTQKGCAKKLSADSQSVLDQLDNTTEKLTLEIGEFNVPCTNLNKVFWPEYGGKPAVTKRDYLRYLARVSQFLIPHLTDRLITLVRFPNGINEGRFYQKHWEQNLPKFVKTARVFTEHEKRDQDFLVCNNLPTLLWLGQIADLEIHTSHTRVVPEPDAMHLSTTMTGSVEALESSIGNYPDFLVLDMDPYLYSGKEKHGEEPELHQKGFENCRKVALYLKEYLDALKLNAYVKTSGKTGLHIYVPLERNIDYDTVRTMSELICGQVLKEHPDETTMDWAIVKRTGRVFLDHNMNARSKSLASIFSPRVAPEGSVSTPVGWDELQDIYPTDFDMQTVPERLLKQGDLWHDILDHKNNLLTLLAPGNASGLDIESGKKKKRSPRKKAAD